MYKAKCFIYKKLKILIQSKTNFKTNTCLFEPTIISHYSQIHFKVDKDSKTLTKKDWWYKTSQ